MSIMAVMAALMLVGSGNPGQKIGKKQTQSLILAGSFRCGVNLRIGRKLFDSKIKESHTLGTRYYEWSTTGDSGKIEGYCGDSQTCEYSFVSKVPSALTISVGQNGTCVILEGLPEKLD